MALFLAKFFGHTSWGSIPLETWCGLGFESPGDMVRLGVRFPFSMVQLGVRFPWRHGAARGSIPLETWCGLEAWTLLRLVPTAEGFAVSCMPGLRPHSCQFVSCRDAIFAGPFVLGSHVWFSFADFESPDRGGLGPLHMSALLWMSFALAWVYTTWPVGGSFSRCSFARRHARDVHRTPALFWIACTSACRSLWLLNHSFGWQVVCLNSFIHWTSSPLGGGAAVSPARGN